MRGHSANEQMISQIQKRLCIAQMGYKKKKFSQKRLKHLKTSRHSNFRYIMKFPSFNMEEQFQGHVKEATEKEEKMELPTTDAKLLLTEICIP